MNINLFINNLLKIAKYLYINQETEHEILEDDSFHRLLTYQNGLTMHCTLQKFQSLLIYTHDARNIPNKYRDILDSIERRIKSIVRGIRDKYRVKILRHPLFEEYKGNRVMSYFLSDEMLPIECIKALLNELYVKEISCSLNIRTVLIDFLYQIFCSTENLEHIRSCIINNTSEDTNVSFCKFFVIFTNLLNFFLYLLVK